MTAFATATARGDTVSAAGGGRFLVYSVTKTFLAVLALLLAERGRLRLDGSVLEWIDLDGVPDVSLRRLLDHTSGIRDYGRLRSYHEAVRESPGAAWPDEELVARALEGGAEFAPGEGWAYSNTGYLLARRALEAAAGPLQAALSEHVLEPLGLHETSVAETRDDLRELVPAASRQVASNDVRAVYDPRWVGHRALASTAADLARFISALTGGRILQDASFAELTRLHDVPVEVAWFSRPSYGLGVMADPEHPSGLVLGHGGGGPGWTACVFGVRGRAAAVLEAREGAALEARTLELLAGA